MQRTKPPPPHTRATIACVTMALGITHLLGLLGVLQAISAAPAPACKLQWGGVTIDGHLGDNNVCRYNIKYGSAERWGESQATAS